MTNMPEAKLAREAELCYATVALATDYDVWHPEHDAVTVEAVIANLIKNVATARDVLRPGHSPRPPARGLQERLSRGSRQGPHHRPAAHPAADAQAPRASRRPPPAGREGRGRAGAWLISTSSGSATPSSTCSATPARSSCAARTWRRGPCSWSTSRGRARSTRRWGRGSRSPEGRRPTPWWASRRSAAAPTTWARCATISSGRSSPTTCAPPAWATPRRPRPAGRPRAAASSSSRRTRSGPCTPFSGPPRISAPATSTRR